MNRDQHGDEVEQSPQHQLGEIRMHLTLAHNHANAGRAERAVDYLRDIETSLNALDERRLAGKAKTAAQVGGCNAEARYHIRELQQLVDAKICASVDSLDTGFEFDTEVVAE